MAAGKSNFQRGIFCPKTSRRAKPLADKLSYKYVDLREHEVDHELFSTIPVELMYRYDFVPLKKSGDYLTVVVSDPTDVLMIDELEMQIGTSVRIAVGTHSAIQDLLKKSESSQRVLEEATEGFRLQVIQEDEEDEEALSVERLTSDASPIIKLVDSIIFNALQRRTSDIHIETREHEVLVKYRIDGVLYQAMEPIDKKFHSMVLSRIKIMSELDIAEKRIPQDGRFKLKVKGRAIDFRVSIIPTAHGEDSVIRILDKESANESFKDLSLGILGWDEPTLVRFRRYIHEPYGMVLVTGPTGSGKTTSLYAALSEIKSDEDKIITIEDPVEYILEGITQIPVNDKKGLTFSKGLRSILRHDPDKVMVGEIRDEETAQIAVQSALTGHLVFTTVHANNVIDVLGRFLNMNVELYNFVSALNCILAQRLVRTICDSCKEPVEYSQELLLDSGLDPTAIRDAQLFEGKGCLECHGTGFRGRESITELLEVNDDIRELILAREAASRIRAAAREAGMHTLRESAIIKMCLGRTTLREINKVTFIR
ncbi:MAG: GspE/PulE family protein [Acidobacteriota bacterium]